jgi:hypothetical protein
MQQGAVQIRMTATTARQQTGLQLKSQQTLAAADM